MKKGKGELPRPIDVEKPRMIGPERDLKISMLFNLSKEDVPIDRFQELLFKVDR